MFDLQSLNSAAAFLEKALPRTPQYAWPLLARRLGTEVVVKHENHLPTGAFKVRGGLTYVDALRRRRPEVPALVSATRGNHGQSLAFAGRRFGVPVTIFVPEGNSLEKNEAMRALGATVIEHGADFQDARKAAAREAERTGAELVPAFHRDLILGVATYALELLTAEPGLDRIYVPIGQGSGICACVLVRDLLGLPTEIVGVQSTEAPAYALSLAAGRIVETPTCATLADGMATRVPDPAAFEIIRRGVARIVLVSDGEVADAVRAFWTDTHNLSEGAGAASLAGALKEREMNIGKRIGLILCGGNIDLALFSRWVLGSQ